MPYRSTPPYGSAVGLPPLAYLVDIVRRCPTEFFELVAAVMLVGWGLAMALPGAVTSGASLALSEIAVPNLVWSLLASSIGLAQVAALAFRKTSLRVLAVACAGAFWGFITAAIVVSARAPAAGVAVYGVMAVACVLVYLRHRT